MSAKPCPVAFQVESATHKPEQQLQHVCWAHVLYAQAPTLQDELPNLIHLCFHAVKQGMMCLLAAGNRAAFSCSTYPALSVMCCCAWVRPGSRLAQTQGLPVNNTQAAAAAEAAAVATGTQTESAAGSMYRSGSWLAGFRWTQDSKSLP